MNKHLTLALAAFAVAGSAFAQAPAPQGSEQTTPPVLQQGSGQGHDAVMQPVGRTRDEVRAELACAKASGEFQAMNTEAYDPLEAQAARERGADLPACQDLGQAGGQ